MGRTGAGTICLWLCVFVLGGIACGKKYVNVALHKNYSQSSKCYPHDSPSWAANGNTNGQYSFGGGNCIHTAVNGDPIPWWEVDLGRTYPVHDITVWPRTNFAGCLYPSDITVDSQLCASISNMDDREKNVTCSSVMYGQRVRITRHPPQETKQSVMTLNLCELQIWVCVSGWYGDQCSTACSPGCQDTSCDPHTGHCSCKAGYTGNTCTGCVSGRYGDKCSRACSHGCQSTTCDQQSGHCSCKAGYTGDTCTGCDDGYYKPSDNTGCEACRGTCQPGTVCDKTTGFCPLCPPGKQGNYCEQGCDDGYYKPSDNTGCEACRGTCQPGTVCDKTTGFCPLCPPGKQGNYCEQGCNDGYYKRSDNTGCDVCRGTCQPGTVCDKTTGFCPLCPPGKQGNYCEQVKKDNDETVNTPVMVGAVVGTGLFIGVCIIILGVILWVLRSRRMARQSRTTTDKPEVTASAESARPAADMGQAKAVFQGVLDKEEDYEIVGDVPMTTKQVHPGISTHPDTTTTHVHPGTSTHPDTTSHVTEADNPYDLPAEQYSNTGELHLYEPWRASRAAHPDDDTDMALHSGHKGKVPMENGKPLYSI